jgi:hypothetical protein
MAGSKPDCQELTMQVIDSNNNKSTETHFVTIADIKDMDNCIFIDKKPNPVTGVKCRETFDNMDTLPVNNLPVNNLPVNNSFVKDFEPSMPKNISSQLYFASLGVLGVYIAFKGLQKMKLVPN